MKVLLKMLQEIELCFITVEHVNFGSMKLLRRVLKPKCHPIFGKSFRIFFLNSFIISVWRAQLYTLISGHIFDCQERTKSNDRNSCVLVMLK